MDSRHGPDRAPHCDYAELMKASDDFLKILRKKCVPPAAIYVPPEIPSRADFRLHEIDNGPGREIFTDSTARIQSAEQRLFAAVTTTVAMVNAKIIKDQRHNPWKKPKVGQFTIIDLGACHCRFPMTESAPHFFCGAAVVDGLPYCDDHCRKAFRGAWSKQ